MTYREITPPPDLREHVECVWVIETGSAVHSHTVLPDGCCDLVYSRRTGVILAGAMPVAQRFALTVQTMQCGIRFHPGAAPAFLGLPASEVTGCTPDFASVSRSRARELDELLKRAASPTAAFLEFARRRRAPLSPIERAIDAIRLAHGNLDLDWAADRSGLSPRQFRRRCEEASGLTPKHLARVLRFRFACELAARQSTPWAQIAAEAGYFDQAHLIRDFREFSGAPPVSLFSNRRAA